MDPDSPVGDSHPSRGSSESDDKESLVLPTGNRDRPSFTFVEHKDNLQTKRIKDAGARKAIRSHVMRGEKLKKRLVEGISNNREIVDVRRRERLSGVKRSTRKGERLDASFDVLTRSGSLPGHIGLRQQSPPSHFIPEGPLPLRVNSAPGKTSARVSTSPRWDAPNASKSHQSNQEAVPSQPLSTLSLGFLDPFRTLPGDPPKRVGNIIHHCATVLLPMTFPVEKKSPQEGRARIDHIVRSAISQQAVFYTYMSFSSAHRALLSGQYSDLIISEKSVQRHIFSQEFFSMKARAIDFLNKMMQDPEQATSDGAVEAVLMLMVTATMIGNFDEGRMHTKGLLKMAQLRGGVNQATFQDHPHIMIAILNSDAKASCITLAKPIFPIPWHIEPLSPSILSRIAPPPGSPLHRFASYFIQVPIFSPKIISLLLNLRDLAYFDDWNARNPEGLSSTEHELVRTKSFETEHALLSYPHDVVASQPTPTTISEIFHPLEMITRTAALLYECSHITVSLPSSGMIRAMIILFKQQLQQLRFQSKGKAPPAAAVDILTWCLFTGAQNSQGEVERPWFVKRLVELAKTKGWTVWEQVEAVMEKFLYVRRVNGEKWRDIWNEVQVLNEGAS